MKLKAFDSYFEETPEFQLEIVDRTHPITSKDLIIVNKDNVDAIRIFVADGLRNGVLLLDGNPAIYFEVKDIQDGKIKYVHDDSNSLEDFVKFRIFDGDSEMLFKFPVKVIPKDDSPPNLIRNNEIVVDNGNSVRIDSKDIWAFDPDSEEKQITYNSMTRPSKGRIMKRRLAKGDWKEVDKYAYRKKEQLETFTISVHPKSYPMDHMYGQTNKDEYDTSTVGEGKLRRQANREDLILNTSTGHKFNPVYLDKQHSLAKKIKQMDFVCSFELNDPFITCTNIWVRDLDNYRYPVEKIGECTTQYGKKDPRCSFTNAENIYNEGSEASTILTNPSAIQVDQSENETKNESYLEKDSSQIPGSQATNSTHGGIKFSDTIGAVGNNVGLSLTRTDPPQKAVKADKNNSLDEAQHVTNFYQAIPNSKNDEIAKDITRVSGGSGAKMTKLAKGIAAVTNYIDSNTTLLNPLRKIEQAFIDEPLDNLQQGTLDLEVGLKNAQKNNSRPSREKTEKTQTLRMRFLTTILNGIPTDIIMNKLEQSKKELNLDEAEDIEEFRVWTSVVDSVAKWKKNKKRKGKRVKRDEEVVCYQELGCFRDAGFFDYLDTLPESPAEIKTRFILHTPTSSEYGEIIDYKNASSLYYSRFMNLAPIKVIIHGFGGGGTKKWVVDMKKALLKSGNFNVIVVDWEQGSDLPNYVQAAANTKLIGKQLSLLIEMINSQRGKTNEDYHIIGFSLGAHVAGFTGMYSKNISRITGLDPAAPLFEGYEDKDRLDVTDANFVDIIHSSGEKLLFGGLGAYEIMGDVDYYPNGGKSQAGCTNLLVGAISDIIYGDWKSLCNHRRAYQMFTESIKPHCPFPSFACDNFENFLNGECFPCKTDGSCGNMGFYADQSKGRGQLYLVTREDKPFCANQYMIEVNSSLANKLTWGKLEVTLITSSGQNETFSLTAESDEIKPGTVIRKVVVAHPNLKNITNIQMRYTQYDGWLYDGKTAWVVDTISLIDSDGHKLYYCGFPVKLRSTHAVSLPVDTVQCVRKTAIHLGLPAAPIINIKKSHRQGRMRWVHQAKRRFPYPFYVPHETVMISRLSSKPKNNYAQRTGQMMRIKHRFNEENVPRGNFRWSPHNFRWRGLIQIPR
ncbi:Pancreatic triacylglycerol lipase [Nymphon striatum]|nr:Pancreatic triacylglycerol lipase [Nymphon striatum]